MSVCFTGSGLNVIYQAGVASFIQQHYDVTKMTLLGNSGGAIIAMLLSVGYDMNKFVDDAHNQIEQIKNSWLGRIDFSRVNYEYMKQIIQQQFGHFNKKQEQDFLFDMRLFVSITTPTLENKLICHFSSFDNLIDVVATSAWIPLFITKCPSFQYNHETMFGMDGGLTNNEPVLNQDTIIVTPYLKKSPNNPGIEGKLPYLSIANLYPREDIEFLFKKGYLDAEENRYLFDAHLQSNKIKAKL